MHEVTAQIRYRHRGVKAQLIARDAAVELSFEEPLDAVTPGQAVVFYRDDEVLGGGWIEEALTEVERSDDTQEASAILAALVERDDA